ncbi:DUF1648 domain-containing protein [Lacticaseibacillus thailandensis]|uniref:DUF1648 domain-containing protein n=1 Tax=Lacticaseibacillus thailandensis DSM 22698 = JCM 13996 TaxID=1423810 RepID=A0A0R2CCX4_9LACO|nr:DUF1648 domain-containing protein [Lacticaseibacillus thailandensis]KRM87844.1 hypothetical protein FD19_GL000121 [Lacticaseibacillus thailandensis DSM 22698 = JCM 13996]
MMKRLAWILRGIDALLVVVAVILMIIATGPVVTHWNGLGNVDATGSKWMLLLIPMVLIVYNEISLWYARRVRRHDGTDQIPLVLVNEWRYVVGALVLLVLGLVFMPMQAGLHFF